MKKKLLLLAFFVSISLCTAQKNVTLKIDHKLGNADFALNQPAQNNLGQEFKISRIDYYISGIILIHDGGMETPVSDKYILTKGGNDVSELLGNFNVTNIEGIKFSIGVESPTNNADPSLQQPGSPLYFQNPSMHWGWSAGYRFVAMEGVAGSNFNTPFEMHGLWNENYFQQTVMVSGINNGNDISIDIEADYTQALKDINVNSGVISHGNNTADLTMLQNFRDNVFRSGMLSTSENSMVKSVNIYPIPTKGTLQIDAGDNKIKEYKLVDMTGRTIDQQTINGSTINLSAKVSKGNYILILYGNDKKVVASKKIIKE